MKSSDQSEPAIKSGHCHCAFCGCELSSGEGEGDDAKLQGRRKVENGYACEVCFMRKTGDALATYAGLVDPPEPEKTKKEEFEDPFM